MSWINRDDLGGNVLVRIRTEENKGIFPCVVETEKVISGSKTFPAWAICICETGASEVWMQKSPIEPNKLDASINMSIPYRWNENHKSKVRGMIRLSAEEAEDFNAWKASKKSASKTEPARHLSQEEIAKVQADHDARANVPMGKRGKNK